MELAFKRCFYKQIIPLRLSLCYNFTMIFLFFQIFQHLNLNLFISHNVMDISLENRLFTVMRCQHTVFAFCHKLTLCIRPQNLSNNNIDIHNNHKFLVTRMTQFSCPDKNCVLVVLKFSTSLSFSITKEVNSNDDISFNEIVASTINLNKRGHIFLSTADVYFLQHYTIIEYILITIRVSCSNTLHINSFVNGVIIFRIVFGLMVLWFW